MASLKAIYGNDFKVTQSVGLSACQENNIPEIKIKLKKFTSNFPMLIHKIVFLDLCRSFYAKYCYAKNST